MIGTIAECATIIIADAGIGMMGSVLTKALTPENANTIEKVCITVGGLAASGAVAKAANDYISEYYDSGRAVIKVLKEKKAKKKEKKEKKESEEETE